MVEYAFQVYWEDNWGAPHYSNIMHDEHAADFFADNRMMAGMRESMVLVLEV